MKIIKGSSQRPRLSVFRSLKHISAQITDDSKATTLVAASTLSKGMKDTFKAKKKTEQAFMVGEMLGKLALQAGVKKVVFDRREYKYHGRVKALADGARKAGLEF